MVMMMMKMTMITIQGVMVYHNLDFDDDDDDHADNNYDDDDDHPGSYGPIKHPEKRH